MTWWLNSNNPGLWLDNTYMCFIWLFIFDLAPYLKIWGAFIGALFLYLTRKPCNSLVQFFFSLNLWLIMIHCQNPLWGKCPNAGIFLEVRVSSSRLPQSQCLCRGLIYSSNQCYCLSYKHHLCICMYLSLGQVDSGPETGTDKRFQLSKTLIFKILRQILI